MKPLKIGMVGLGRLGKRHAENLALRTPGASIEAACSVVPEELEWAQERLGVKNLFGDYGAMLVSADIDAVFIASSSAVHAAQAIAALKAGKHVFCEKPMGISIQECLEVEAAAAAHPKSTFMVGFVRRFDPSYRYAKELIEQGAIGEPFLVRSQTVDLDEYAAFQVGFVPTSGGIFMDMNIHDIDLARWYLGDEVNSAYAIGGSFVHPEFAQVMDADNTCALLTFSTGKMADLSVSRTAFHGHDTHTEIVGSRGILKIGITPVKNRVEIFDSFGARKPCVRDFYERFEEAFRAEAAAFVECARSGATPIVGARDGTEATRVGFCLTESFRKGRIATIRR
ncbi:MAG: myo-inositol 2-dehydrogenase [Spirochaetes bacterium]|nr:MAG: myo-inositol 2-dehydrogenase [Spirochaetota bacterium]